MTELLEYERILVPTDFSEGSRRALERAVSIARGTQAEIVLLHVVEPMVAPTIFPEQSLATLDLSGWMERAERRLRGLVQEYRAKGARIREVVRPGYPAHDIIETAREEGVDLIVIGSAGHTAAAYAFLGSTVERVVRKAHCEVLVTRSGAARSEPARGGGP
jgi:nucleotide-binding universal stress UspA family protein